MANELSTINGDIHLNGHFSSKTMTVPNNTITNAMINASAAIDATKHEHRHNKCYSQEAATNAADETRVLHVVHGATATVIAFAAGAVVAATGDSTCTFDLKKNGSTILTAPISLDSGDAAYALVAGAIASAGLVQGDVLSVTINETVGTGTRQQGVFVKLVLDEDPA